MSPRHRRRFLRVPEPGESTFVGDFLRSETVGGAIALIAAGVALLWANLDGASYETFRQLRAGPLDMEHWAADGALAIFFFVAGLELKREFVVNRGTDNLGGWAIPAATDIAFALAVLAVVGSALPTQLRAFLLTLAVVDDLIVIVIIAIFYTETLSFGWLAAAVALLTTYAAAQRARLRTRLIYLPLAAVTWWCVYQSGIHATIAGVLLGLLTRVLPDEGEARSPAERLEHRLSPVSSGLAVPFFALLSAGVVVQGGGQLFGPVLWGVAIGLVVGKPIGVLTGTWLVTRFTRAELDPSVSWRDVVGIALLAGVGFTVSLLVADLSFTDDRRTEAKTAVLLGSAVSGMLAAAVLARRNRRHRDA
jgi:NhaA family Na+:H+ antiporter